MPLPVFTRNTALKTGKPAMPFLMIGQEVIPHIREFSARNWLVFTTLNLLSDGNGVISVTLSELCETTGFSRETLQTAIAELCGMKVGGRRLMRKIPCTHFGANTFVMFPGRPDAPYRGVPHIDLPARQKAAPVDPVIPSEVLPLYPLETLDALPETPLPLTTNRGLPDAYKNLDSSGNLPGIVAEELPYIVAANSRYSSFNVEYIEKKEENNFHPTDENTNLACFDMNISNEGTETAETPVQALKDDEESIGVFPYLEKPIPTTEAKIRAKKGKAKATANGASDKPRRAAPPRDTENPKNAADLLALYITLFQESYNRAPVMNHAAFGARMKAVIADTDPAAAALVIRYFFADDHEFARFFASKGHAANYLIYQWQEIDAKCNRVADKKEYNPNAAYEKKQKEELERRRKEEDGELVPVHLQKLFAGFDENWNPIT